jgi:hypothetical protein
VVQVVEEALAGPAVVDLAHLPVLAQAAAHRAQRAQRAQAPRLARLPLLLAKAAPPVRALLPVVVALAVLAHLVVEAAVPVALLLLLLSPRSF